MKRQKAIDFERAEFYYMFRISGFIILFFLIIFHITEIVPESV